MILRTIRRRLAEIRTYAVYGERPEQDAQRFDELIGTHDWANLPSPGVRELYQRFVGPVGRRLMLSRLARRKAIQLLIVDNSTLVAYGWIQDWSLFRRQFRWLTDDGVCLGPYWTHPDCRGRGLYGRMLRHSLAITRERHFGRAFIWADADNTASRRGIEKAGFEPLGVHRLARYAAGLVHRHQTISPPASG